MSSARLGDQLRDGGGAPVAQELEPGNHRRRLGPHVRAVDRATLLGALEDRDEDLEQELLRPGHLDAGPRELERRLEQLAATAAGRAAACASARPATRPGTATEAGADVEHLRRGVAEVDQHLVHRPVPP